MQCVTALVVKGLKLGTIHSRREGSSLVTDSIYSPKTKMTMRICVVTVFLLHKVICVGSHEEALR